ncbi:hypothetical protein F4810DRAFT_4894 [Camillea tinctor]|nr:hypothetical protein F4810DRAFT_4894 [Camillea tinctor]
MAIIEAIPGIEVTIQVNGQKAVEYDDPHASEQESFADCPISCKYIESIDDATFRASITASQAYSWRHHAFAATLYADGQRVGSHVMEKSYDEHRTSLGGFAHFDSAKQQWYRRYCKFAAISTVDSSVQDRVQKDQKLVASLGILEVRLRYVRVLGRYSRSPGSSEDDPLGARHEVSEKSLKGKAISHGTAFSSGKKTHVPLNVNTENIPGERSYFGVYRFYYRSKEALKQELIIPRSPSPAHGISGLSQAEIERLARERLDQIKACHE